MDTSNFKEVFESPKVKALTAQVAALELEVVRLRNALETFIAEHEECEDGDGWMAQMCSMEALHVADEVMSAPFTPTALNELIEKVEKPEPAESEPVEYPLNGTRFKLSFQEIECDECGTESPYVLVTPLDQYANELNGKWVALVPAENDRHLHMTPPPDRTAELEAICKDHGEIQHSLCERIAELEAALEVEIVKLRECLNNWIDIASNCTIESGCCCCGESMDGHSNPMDCGHSPQDMADGAVNSAIEKTNKALSTPFTHTALNELIENVERLTIERCAGECKTLDRKEKRHATGYGPGYLTYTASDCEQIIRTLPTGQIKLEELIKT